MDLDQLRAEVWKRDGGCFICFELTRIKLSNLDKGATFEEKRKCYPLEPNGLHLHHEYGTYGDEYWPRQDVLEKCVILCAHHHARRTQDSHYSETRDIRKYLKKLYPDYNFGKRFNENTGAYDIPIGEF